MDIVEICNEITRLKSADTTLRNCELLAVLYTAKKCLYDGTGELLEPSRLYAEQGMTKRTEFATVALKADYDRLINVLDAHMEQLKESYPQEYRHIIEQLKK